MEDKSSKEIFQKGFHTNITSRHFKLTPPTQHRKNDFQRPSSENIEFSFRFILVNKVAAVQPEPSSHLPHIIQFVMYIKMFAQYMVIVENSVMIVQYIEAGLKKKVL